MPAGIRDPDMPGDQIGDKLSCIPKVAGLNIFIFFDGLGGACWVCQVNENERLVSVDFSFKRRSCRKGGKGKVNRQRSTSSLLMVRWT